MAQLPVISHHLLLSQNMGQNNPKTIIIIWTITTNPAPLSRSRETVERTALLHQYHSIAFV